MKISWFVQRAALRLALTPQERAVLQFVKILLEGALLTALVAIEPLLTGQPVVDWNLVVHLFIFTFFMALVHGTEKYITAHADAQYAPLSVNEQGVKVDASPAIAVSITASPVNPQEAQEVLSLGTVKDAQP